MSGKFVRASKYRHVFGEAARKDKCITGIKPVNNDGNMITDNGKFVAWVGVGGGGPINLQPHGVPSRLGQNVPTINTHKNAVLALEFNPFVSNMLATGSDDCQVHVSMFEDDFKNWKDVTKPVATFEGHGKKVSYLHWHPTANNILASGSADNYIKVWDVEQGKLATEIQAPDMMYSFEWNNNGSLLASTHNKTVRIADPRAPKDAASFAGCQGNKPSSRAVWLDNVGYFGVVGFSSNGARQLLLFALNKYNEPVHSVDLDQSAGQLMPFYDSDTSVLFLAGKGDANIRYYEITNEGAFHLSEFRDNESHKAVAWIPKRFCDVPACEIAQCLRLKNDHIQPVPFFVPRKSDMFQEDLFPDTYAGVPAMSSADWLGGKNANPPTQSMRPGAVKEAPKAQAVLKPASVLQAELEAAHKRIAELEAELKKLKH